MNTHEIKALHVRNILNSHVQFTTEFVIEFQDGARGTGSSSQGETISIYEDRTSAVDPHTILEAIRADHLGGRRIDQSEFDRYLMAHLDRFGRNNCFALSLAFHSAAANGAGGTGFHPGVVPRLCLNILNGGWHAYTNPVLCDFSEIMLVPRQDNVVDTLQEHRQIQERVREKLLRREKVEVNGNPVNTFPVRDNRAPVEFLLDILEELGLGDKYRLMIDASAGDLRTAEGYHFSLTDGSRRTTDELGAYWAAFIADYGLQFLEDPFQEKDFAGWQALTAARPNGCEIIGDNLYSSDAARIAAGAAAGQSHGVIIKPNQAGTVSATVDAIQAARSHQQTIIASHRSISTESTYLCDITHQYRIPFIKIGPLFTDYSSVVRLNELIRLAGVGYV